MASQSGPFEGIERMVERMNQQLESLTQTVETGAEETGLELPLGGLARTTGLDLADHDDSFVVSVDVPGYDAADIELTLTDSWLKIRGRREQTTAEASDSQFIRHERRDRSFHRQVHLPEPVVHDGVEASINNGVLTVALPKEDGGDEGRTIRIE